MMLPQRVVRRSNGLTTCCGASTVPNPELALKAHALSQRICASCKRPVQVSLVKVGQGVVMFVGDTPVGEDGEYHVRYKPARHGRGKGK
jgi:hypothetical protein